MPAADLHYTVSTEQLVQQIKETADKLIRDQANRGDVKLLNTALKELRYAFKVFAPFRHRRKVTVFGSARLPPSDPAYVQAVEFGRRIAEAGFMVVTGAASGIMEAGHVGAGRENSIGVNIMLPFEQDANSIIAGDNKLMHLKYFFTRKLLFVKESDAIALFPGGFGTLDEGFEVLTLIQTGKSHLFPIVMVDEPGGTYWKNWDAFMQSTLVKRGLISPEDVALYKVTDSVEEAVAEVLDFYRVYHSMRYVGKDLVFRLQHPLSPAMLERIRKEFAEILRSGTYEAVEALPEEANDTHLASLPRLRFHFDRRNLGRLRMLIDTINEDVVAG
ncbi:cytochrome D ubiquinol oxidase subunit II [Planctomycetaceae bacterium SCGC AG-212-D15]|nr:cytochrome D ubiquinol oxidase subunit II [Planctomycetaceae bacterium SCGC AG-212-D15]